MSSFTLLEFNELVSAALRTSDERLTLEALPNAADRGLGSLGAKLVPVPEKGLRVSFHPIPPTPPSSSPLSAVAATMLGRFKRHASSVFGAHSQSQPQARTTPPAQTHHHLPIPIISISDSYKHSCDSARTASTDDYIPYLPLASQYELNSSSPPVQPTTSCAASISSLSSSSSSSSLSSADDPVSPTTPSTPSFPTTILTPSADPDTDTDPFVKLPVQIITKPRRRPSLRPPPPSPPPAGPLPRTPVEWTLGLGVPRRPPPATLPPRPVSPSPLPKNKTPHAHKRASAPTGPAPGPALPLFEPHVQRPVLRMKSMPSALTLEDWTLSLPVHLSPRPCPSAFLAPRAPRTERASSPVPPVRVRTQSHPHPHERARYESTATTSTLVEPPAHLARTRTRSTRRTPPPSPPPASPPPAVPHDAAHLRPCVVNSKRAANVDSGFWDAADAFEDPSSSVYETARSSFQSSFLEI